MSRAKRVFRQLLRLCRENQESLLFALPYLVFIGFSIWNTYQVRSGGLFALTVLISLIIAGLYCLTWIVNPLAPNKISAFLLVVILVIFCLGVLASLILPMNLTLATFALSPWIFQAPKHLIFPGVSLLIALSLGVCLALGFGWQSFWIVLGVLVGTGMICMVARFSIERDKERNIDRELRFLDQRRGDHAQIRSDLHDVLGQELTGLSIKAELADRLLEEDRVDEARIQLQSLRDLARVALQDVRNVVSKTREWSLDQELDESSDLLAAAGVELLIEREGDLYLDPVRQAYARVLREAITNAVNHAQPSWCQVRISPERLEVENDGVRRLGREARGLSSLQKSVASIGDLTWNKRGNTWVVALEVQA